jgi:hypothetical protein
MRTREDVLNSSYQPELRRCSISVEQGRCRHGVEAAGFTRIERHVYGAPSVPVLQQFTPLN